MIYILKSAAYTDSGFIELIKIGFTDNWKRRCSQYLLHNPTIRVLYLLEEGTLADEYNLHQLFQRFKYEGYGNEWFHFNDNIVQFFESYGHSVTDLRDHLPDYSKEVFDDTYDIRILSDSVVRNLGDVDIYYEKRLIKDLKNEEFRNLVSALAYIRARYGDLTDMILDTYEQLLCNAKDNEVEIEEFMSKYNQGGNPSAKMKILCEAKLSGIVLESALNRVAEYHKRFYIFLGPEKCKSLGYNYTRMKQECSTRLFSVSELEEAIYSNFSEGDRITKVELKKKLTEIYDSINYRVAAKAIDIKNWFRIKRSQITVDGKSKEGFLLLEKLR